MEEQLFIEASSRQQRYGEIARDYYRKGMITESEGYIGRAFTERMMFVSEKSHFDMLQEVFDEAFFAV